MQRCYIIFETENDGVFFSVTREGEIIEYDAEDGQLDLAHVYGAEFSNDELEEADELFDANLVKNSKHLREMLPDFFKTTSITELKVNIGDKVVIVWGVPVKRSILHYKL